MTNTLTVLILTFNEEKHIARCIRSAAQVARDIIVVDSYSTDQTVAVARSCGAQVWQHEFRNHAAQVAWALEHVPIAGNWVMRMDADEIISPALAAELNSALDDGDAATNGYLVYRHVCFEGQIIRHGGVPHWVLRIWRKDTARIEQRWMDEHMVLDCGNARKLHGEYVDDNLNNIAWWTDKHNRYSTREAIDLLNHKYRFASFLAGNNTLTSQARHTRWFKENLYERLPLGIRAFLFFAYRMIFRLGILDGRKGLVFHFLQGFWYRFLVDVKVREVEQRMRAEGIDCVEAIRREFGVNPLP